ncbi:phosphopyruvate hydratase [Geminicoccus roseus]|uniref:phosphopyruvate hydratase n=1 Tax=Geminicoccus roseus TaxID=404900 RepID=UPI0003FF9601|nr:phosphopyruvate hydratase [Geminicoccus roseus]
MTHRIDSIVARRVWDSRGRPAVEADVVTSGGALGRAIAPAGASTGSGEALDRRDGGAEFGGMDVQGAVASVNGPIAQALRGAEVGDQAGIDRILIELDGTAEKSKLGGNATIAVSMAVAHAAAAAEGVPLWRWLGGDAVDTLPLPEIQIFGGGAHAAGRLDIQDFMVVCPGAASFAQALEWTAEVYRAAGGLMKDAGKLAGVADEGGFWPLFDSNEEALGMLTRAIERAGYRPYEQVAISLDVAASQFGKDGRYRLARDGSDLDAAGMIEVLAGWIGRYPIVSVEDPLAEDDATGFQAFASRLGGQVQVVGDDFLVTDAARVKTAAAEKQCDTVLVKPNQRGTLTETRAAWEAAKAAGMGAIVSARSGESEDTTIVHLAVGWGVPQLKVGSFTRSERMAKWNEAIRVEEQLGRSARFAGALPYRSKAAYRA